MRNRARITKRIAMLAVLVTAVAAVVALPAAAYAKSATRFVLASTVTVVNSNPASATPWPQTLTAKLQKKSGRSYRVYKSAWVSLYKYNDFSGTYGYVTRVKSSSKGAVSFSISGRGKYRLSAPSTSANKACTGYSTYREDIGLAISDPTFGFTSGVAPGTTDVSISYDTTWNAAAFDGRPMVDCEAYFANDYDVNYGEGDWIRYQREVAQPGTVTFTFNVKTTGLLPVLQTYTNAFVDKYWDAYIVPADERDFTYDVP